MKRLQVCFQAFFLIGMSPFVNDYEKRMYLSFRFKKIKKCRIELLSK